jgi:hypothetical protein
MSMTAKDAPPCPKCKADKSMKLVSRTIAHTPTAFALPGEQERPPARDAEGKCTRCGE